MERPLILNFVSKRTSDEQKIFTYDENMDLNVIESNGLKVPFIEAAPDSVELITKTEAVRERDDESPRLAEMLIKTRVERENDDTGLSLVEIMTNTKAVPRESDE